MTGRLGQESGTLLKLVQFKALFPSQIVGFVVVVD